MSDTRPSVLVLMGGPDAEREVSLMSARAVAQALRDAERFDVHEAVVDRPDALELDRLPGDIVFPVLHGQWGEGGPLQRELETLGRPYVGSGPEASALAMDKLKTKSLLARDGVATPESVELAAGAPCPIDAPLVLKPVDDGSSVDIRICASRDEVDAARAVLHIRRPRLMAERFIAGRELTVGMVCGETLPLIEIIPAADFYDYDAKYERDDTRYVVDPDVQPDVVSLCREVSRLAWERVRCRDVARVDFLLDDAGTAWFLEINTMPGFTSHSLLPLAARHRGLEMPALCACLVDAAVKRPRAAIGSGVGGR